MTDIKISTDKAINRHPKFKELTEGQYFKFTYTGEDGYIYIKLPSIYRYDVNECGAWQYTYNAYNLTSNKLCNINIEKECELIEKVEIHV